MKGKKKSIIIFVAVMGVVVVGLFLLFFPRKSSSFYGKELSSIKSICIMSGNTGDIVFLDREDYETVVDSLDEVSFIPNYIPSQMSGWSYKVVIETNTENVSMTFSGDRCTVNNTEYKCIDGTDEGIVNFLKKVSGL